MAYVVGKQASDSSEMHTPRGKDADRKGTAVVILLILSARTQQQ